MTRQEMIDELMEGTVFDDDSMIARLLSKLSDEELKELLEE